MPSIVSLVMLCGETILRFASIQNKKLFFSHFTFIKIALCSLLSLSTLFAFAQADEPHRLQIGASIGAGGLHTYLKPSIDLHYYKTSLRLAPGLFFMSAGVTQRLFPIKYRFLQRPPFRTRTPLIVSAYYHWGWLLTGQPLHKETQAPRQNLQMIMLLLGLHGKLDRLNRVYWEGSVGATYARASYLDGSATNSFFPMAELRIGGIVQFHKDYRQKQKNTTKSEE